MELNPFEFLESPPLSKEDAYSYRHLLKSITDQVTWIIEAGFQDYDGNYFFLGQDANSAFYFVVGGYGSCSFCDALQACEALEDFLELRDNIKRSIRKFDSAQEFEQWFNDRAQTEWYPTEDALDFIKQANSQFPFTLKWRGRG